MPEVVSAIVVLAWIAEALALGYVMGRRGYEAYSWTALGLFLGPIAVAVAIGYLRKPLSRESKLLHGGHVGGGRIDVLIGVDGSAEAHAAVERAAHLFGPTADRVTLARVVPLDAAPETLTEAERELERARALCRPIDASAVVLKGEPVTTLRDYVVRHGYDVLVVGTRGKGRTTFVLGSVAIGLARGAGIPVLVVDVERAATNEGASTPTLTARS